MSKNYLITGACRGIGRGLSRLLLQSGHRVLLIDNDVVEMENMRTQLPKWLKDGRPPNESYHIHYADLSRADDIEAVARVASGFFRGRLDVLVNNAGFTGGAHAKKIDTQDFLKIWDTSIKVNLTGSMLMTRACLSMLKREKNRQNGGNVIMISSTRAYQSEPNSEAYASTKAGLLGLSQSLACSLASENIKVNAILPGWINVAHECKEGDDKGSTWEDGLTADDQTWHFAGRVGRVEDVLKAVEYLSDADSFITGEEIRVDGGVTRRMTYPE